MVWKLLKKLRKKSQPVINLTQRQEVELEFVTPEGTEDYFTKVLEFDKKKIILAVPQRNRQYVPCSAGDKLIVTYIKDNFVTSFVSAIIDREEKEITLSTPKDIRQKKINVSKEEFFIDIPIPVEYRALTTSHLQTAKTKSLTSKGVEIITNLPIPQGTVLYMEFEIPNAPTIKAKGKVVRSDRLPSDSRKNLTAIEFEDIHPLDKENMLRYALYYEQRQLRRQQKD